MSVTAELMRKAELRVTPVRTAVLELFQWNNFALSEKDLELQLKNDCDRATIYRTIKTFMENGILHRVIDEDNVVKYALCAHDCKEVKRHAHEHTHFKCEQCGKTICLEDTPIQPVTLPAGFSQRESNLLILGVCADCNQ